jgi:hypothetical protein
MRSHWIEHKGKQIFYCDYTNFSLVDFQALKAELDAVVDFLAKQPESSVLGLTDIRGSVASSQVIELFKKSATGTAKYIKRQAVFGVTGFKGVFFDLIVRLSGQNARAFEDMEAAKDWLVQDRD